MNSNLETLVKNLLDDDFNYLSEEVGSKNLQLLKQKGSYPYEYMNILIIHLVKRNCLIENAFAAQKKMEQLAMMVKS